MPVLSVALQLLTTGIGLVSPPLAEPSGLLVLPPEPPWLTEPPSPPAPPVSSPPEPPWALPPEPPLPPELTSPPSPPPPLGPLSALQAASSHPEQSAT